MARVIKMYRTYNLLDKDPAIDRVRVILKEDEEQRAHNRATASEPHPQPEPGDEA